MKVGGKHVFERDVAEVWDALLSPEALAHCMPGCEKFEVVAPEHYQAEMKVGVGAIKGSFTGIIRVAEKEPTSRYKLTVEGSGGPGKVKGEGVVSLIAVENGTEMMYEGDVQVMGPVAAVGQRLLGAASQMLIAQFFKCMDRWMQSTQDGSGS